MEYPNLDELDTRAQMHGCNDGIQELMFGLLVMLWGLAIGLQQFLLLRGTLRWLWMGTMTLLVFGGFVTRWITLRLKQRYTFPRIGYARVATPNRRLALVIAVATAVGAFTGTLTALSRRGRMDEFVVPGLGVLFAVVITFSIVQSGMKHASIPVGLSIVLVVALTIVPLKIDQGFAALLFGIGCILAATGALRLRAFLHDNPPHSETIE